MVTSAVEQENFLDHLFSTVYITYSLVGIVLNLILLWLIITQKNDCIREYRILLGNTTCALLLLSALTLFLQLRFVVAGNSLGYVALGPARFLNMPRLVLFCTSLMLTIDIYSFMTIAMCMVYKYLTLTESSPSEEKLLIGIGLFFLLPLSTGIALLVYDPDYSELHTILEELRPEYDLERYGNYSGLPNVRSIYVMYLIVVICSIGVSSYIVMIIAGVKLPGSREYPFQIQRLVLTSHSKMSASNMRIFKMMVKALVIQSFMPVFFSFPTKILYLTVQFGAFRSLTAEYLMFAMSPVVSIIDPCVTMYFVVPYRRYLRKKLGFSKKIGKSSNTETEQSFTRRSSSWNKPTLTQISSD
ncbi:7TM chemoreceptor [Necator americanus]|uniref:7TM chemoreceptor n=1 Tax=Necator americanus TaxID=51031 RepID=W2T740_NECAM|nr:7TM chemoreceptor [Necator americanus]ETN77454.1 7TM chemoreceptor [Necator americanus]